MENEELVRKGRKASQLLEDETFNMAINKMENDQLWYFRSTKPEESAKREIAWSMLKAIDNLKIELQKTVDNAKVAQRAIERANK
jgi:hypothetical protein